MLQPGRRFVNLHGYLIAGTDRSCGFAAIEMNVSEWRNELLEEKMAS
jgi:hypothetical protein